MVLVEGIVEENVGEVRVRFEFDGQTLRTNVGLEEAVQVDEHSYLIGVEVDTGIDWQPYEGHHLTAVVDLPEGGTSRHRVLNLWTPPYECLTAGYVMTDEDGNLTVNRPAGQCAGLALEMNQPETWYMMCACGERLEQSDGEVQYCGILSSLGKGSREPNWREDSPCYDEELAESIPWPE